MLFMKLIFKRQYNIFFIDLHFTSISKYWVGLLTDLCLFSIPLYHKGEYILIML